MRNPRNMCHECMSGRKQSSHVCCTLTLWEADSGEGTHRHIRLFGTCIFMSANGVDVHWFEFIAATHYSVRAQT